MSWSPQEPRPGQWMVRAVRNGPAVCARIWVCHHEPGEPDNIMDRPYLQGQLGLDLTPPLEIWAMLEFVEASPEQKQALASPPEVARTPRNGRKPALVTAPMPKWRRDRAWRISRHQYEHELRWHEWAASNKPDHPDFTYRKPVDRKSAPAPKWADPERLI